MLSAPTPGTDSATVELHSPNGRFRCLDTAREVRLEIGRVLRDRYVIHERLGSGGRGSVFKALDRYRSALPETERYVALKVLHDGPDCSNGMIGDLQGELHCGQLLSHPNIVNIFELDRDGDLVFFTMEFLDGELLSDLMGRMRPAAMQRPQAMLMINQLSTGLSHAHERGVVHGDLKPQNLFVTCEGQLRILDFGTARAMARPHAHERVLTSGTPAYASCEMLEGRAIEARDDMYALACICYELLTGVHPFAGRPATVARDYGVRATRPAGLTGRQWRTLGRGLSWHRAGRSMGVRAFVQGLTHHVIHKPTTTPLKELAATRTARPLQHSSRVAAISIALLALAGVCIAQLKAPSPKHAGVATRTPPDIVMLTAPQAASASGSPPPAVESGAGLGPAGAKAVPDGAARAQPAARQVRSTISVDGYQVSMSDRFVEIRVHRDRSQRNGAFAWWTEPATAKQDVDYVHQANAIQSFAPQQRSTRFYVKLLPDPGRSQRDFFYVAIAQPGRMRSSVGVTRVQIWLPAARDHMQASR